MEVHGRLMTCNPKSIINLKINSRWNSFIREGRFFDIESRDNVTSIWLIKSEGWKSERVKKINARGERKKRRKKERRRQYKSQTTVAYISIE